MSKLIYGFPETSENDQVLCVDCLKLLGLKRYKNINSEWFYGKTCYFDETLEINYISEDNKKIVDDAFKIASKIKKKLFKETYESPNYEIIEYNDEYRKLNYYEKEYHMWSHVYTVNIVFTTT